MSHKIAPDTKLCNLLAAFLTAVVLTACSSGSSTPATSEITDGDSEGVTDNAASGTDAESADEGLSGTGAESTDEGSSDTNGSEGSTGGGTTAGTNDTGNVDSAPSGNADANPMDADAGMDTDGDTSGVTNGGLPQEVDPTPIVRVPADTQILITDELSLNGSITFTGMPIDIPVTQWVKLSGPGNAVFSDENAANTTVTFDEAGTYVLELTASNGEFIGSDQITIVVTAVTVNQPPVVDAGGDESVTIDQVLTLSAQISDDGLPANTLSGTWSKEVGPGDVTFGELSDTNTTASFSATGKYELQYTATDGELSTSDELAVEVLNAEPVSNPEDNVNASNQWQTVNTANGSKPQARHESAAVTYQNKLYLMGGRGIRQVNRYDPSANSWENLGSPGFELSHFQPVVYGGKIYVIGSLDCCFPSETVIPDIQIFDPSTKRWSKGASIPQNRRRGSAGVVLHNNKIYIVGGSTNGHDGGMVSWFDEYNPANNTWKTLPDAPTKRDHFSAAMVGNKLVAAGGRQTDHPATFKNLVSSIDIYDFGTGEWTSGVNIPTQRAGAMTVSHGDEVILIGGEKDTGIQSLSSVLAYNVKTNSWRTLNSLNTERHSGGAAIVDGAIHVVSGNVTTGGGNETQAHEKLNLD